MGKITVDKDKYNLIVNHIDTTGKSLLEKTDYYTPSDRVVQNAVIPDYVVAYEGMVNTINYLMGVNTKVVTLMNNVMNYHNNIDQQKSDQLNRAGDVFSSDEGH